MDNINGFPADLQWFKSSLSYSNGNCVEVAFLPDGTAYVRDSKDPGGPALRFTPAEWAAFTGGVRAGEFDRPGTGVLTSPATRSS
jgi:hypothetical protein